MLYVSILFLLTSACKIGRVSYERETQLIKEVKALEEKNLMRLKNKRLFGMPESQKLDDLVDNLTNVFQRMTPNGMESIRSIYRCEQIYMVSSIIYVFYFALFLMIVTNCIL